MTRLPEMLRASYAACRRTTRQARSNFPISFLLLSRHKRLAMEALYAFMRHTDDLADGPESVSTRRSALSRWRASLSDALAGRSLGTTTGEPHHRVLGDGDDTAAEGFLPAVADAIRRFGIPRACFDQAVDGAEMDLDQQSYETFDELLQYCQRVASAVGRACIHIWGFRDERALEPARKCGIAFQLTNILRDLKEDAARGRVYLPQEDLRRFGYTAEDLAAGTADERFDRLLDFQIERAERFYREGVKLIDWLGRDGQRVFGMMASLYHALLEEIRHHGRDVLTGRVSLGRFKKLRLAARWLLRPPKTILPESE